MSLDLDEIKKRAEADVTLYCDKLNKNRNSICDEIYDIRDRLAMIQEIERLRALLGESVSTLELYRGIAGHDCDKNTTKYSAADVFLQRLKEGGG